MTMCVCIACVCVWICVGACVGGCVSEWVTMPQTEFFLFFCMKKEFSP